MKAPCLPGKMLNLLSMKQPIIAHVPSDSETASVVKKAKCGIVVDQGDMDSITKAIDWLKKHPDEAKQMGENGHNAVVTKYNWENEEKKIISLYRSVLKI